MKIAESQVDRISRSPEVEKITGLSKVTIWRQERQGQFPRRVRIGRRSVGWFTSEIEAWLQDKKKARVVRSTGF